jgi:8-oxo-dGTP pyrophosphatase MutT (NUDIX family)
MKTAGVQSSWAEQCFIGATERLPLLNAAAAILVLEDGRYVMQLRDASPSIFYPGHWGCFGGAVERGETPLAAMKRELAEELEYVPQRCDEFTRFDFDFSKVGQSKIYRIYYEVHVSEAAFGKFVLHEGAAFEAINGRDLLTKRKVAPYDAFAVWTHMHARRFEQA